MMDVHIDASALGVQISHALAPDARVTATRWASLA